ncbi:MAG: hypothetical protein ACFFDW_15045, partial [Candidatus Thorarchaeota archaeon]
KEIKTSEELGAIKYYTDLNLSSFTENDLLRFIRKRKKFAFSLNEQSDDNYSTFGILKKDSFLALNIEGGTISILIIFSVLFSLVYSLIFSIVTVSLNSSKYPAIILTSIDILLLIFLLFNFIKAQGKFSKKWFALECQKNFIKVLYFPKSITFGMDIKTIAISDISEFEFGFIENYDKSIENYNKNKSIVYFTLRMKDNMNYYFGEIYNDTFFVEKYNYQNLLEFIEKYYKLPIVTSNAKYKKRRKQIMLTNLPLVICYAILNIASLILSLIYISQI